MLAGQAQPLSAIIAKKHFQMLTDEQIASSHIRAITNRPVSQKIGNLCQKPGLALRGSAHHYPMRPGARNCCFGCLRRGYIAIS